MQVDPIKPTLKAPGSKRLKLDYDEPLLNFAFKFNLRRCNEACMANPDIARATGGGKYLIGRGLHSSTFQLNLSRF